jgi:hypothetical protein
MARLLITDVTEMHNGNFCVAGWDIDHSGMVRPLPNGANWTAALISQHAIVPGAVINVEFSEVQHNSNYPHLTEDRHINSATTVNLNAAAPNWFAYNAPPVAASIAAAFGGNVQHNSTWNGRLQGVFVPSGTQFGSLAAVALPRANIVFEGKRPASRFL